MSEKKKPEGGNADTGTPRNRPHREMNADKANGKRAPDQNVLPGIIGKQLRAAYGEMLNAPVPDAFTDLIKHLKEGEKAARSNAQERPDPEEHEQ